jgi:RNA polymerase sigma-70 factor (ECF subfamily)
VSLDEKLSADDDATFADQFPDGGPNPEQVFAREELRDVLHRHLSRLSPVLRSAFLLREVQGLSTQEAAESLGVSEGTLKARLHRAKRQLANLFGRALGGSRDARNGRRHKPAFGTAASPYASPCASD